MTMALPFAMRDCLFAVPHSESLHGFCFLEHIVLYWVLALENL